MDLRRIPPEVLLGVIVAVGLVALAQSFRLAFRSWRVRRRLARAAARGAWGEARAERLLLDRGFRVVGRQVGARYEVIVDDEPVAIRLRADYIVSDGRDRYVAEVKTGEHAPRIDTVATRRQLLEYCVGFQDLNVTGLLLVDAESDRVQRVVFPVPRASALRERPGLVWLVLGVIVGTVTAIAVKVGIFSLPVP